MDASIIAVLARGHHNHLKLREVKLFYALQCMCMSNEFHFVPLPGEEYIIRDGKVAIVDTFTGRVLEGRRWSDGMHQAIECKENISVSILAVMRR